MGDAECSKVQDCPMKCGCGDDDCLEACAAQTSSPLAVPVIECICQECHDEFWVLESSSNSSFVAAEEQPLQAGRPNL